MNEELKWEPLNSSHVNAMAHDASNAKLFVEFKGGQIYEYPADAEEANALRTAESPGRYVNFFLKQKGSRVS